MMFRSSVPSLLPQTSGSPDTGPSAPIRSLADLEAKGEFLGKGSNGAAYRIGERVYKVYDILLPGEEVQGIVKSWNQTYTDIYGGKFKKFADASYQTIKDDKYVHLDRPVMVMPFIDSKAPRECNFCFINDCVFACCPGLFCCLCCTPDIKQLNQELRKLNLEMADYYVEGNIKIHNGVALPIDFDCVLPIPTVTENEVIFHQPPSALAIRRYKRIYPHKAVFFAGDAKEEAKAASPTTEITSPTKSASATPSSLSNT